MSIQPGTDIGRYHILEQLGEGGMAVVYKAYDTRLENEVAIKFIRVGEFPANALPRILKRFQIEAKKMAQLQHPNIVKVMDYGEFEDVPYLVMEYLPGGTLKEKLGYPFPFQDVVKLLLPIADALGYAHSKGLIHRDIKPSNILITESGQPMLSDFGVAKVLESDETLDLTVTGMGVGTPEYMAPEMGLQKRFDHRADIYSLGVVFYELVTGRKPFTADTPMAVLFKHFSDPLPRPSEFVPGLPQETERLLFKMLAKEPDSRFQDMVELIAALENAAGLTNKNFRSSSVKQIKEQWVGKTFNSESEAGQSTGEELGIDSPLETRINGRLAPPPKSSTGKQDRKSAADTGHTLLWVLGAFGIIVLAILISGLFENEVRIVNPKNAKPGIGSTMVSEKDGMTLVYVPEGDFKMGSVDGYDDEKPVHIVYLDAFWIDRTEVTNAQYQKCVDSGACTQPEITSSNSRDSYFGSSEYADYPVIYVDWNQAHDYCQWADRRLPTEAEWEKAARGTDWRIYPWGNRMPNSALLNFDRNESDTTTVGSYSQGASPSGALDMAGNVWEWVADWHDSGYYSSRNDWSNPAGPSFGEFRVLRGGSWKFNDSHVRSADRYKNDPSNRNYNNGFRCAMGAE